MTDDDIVVRFYIEDDVLMKSEPMYGYEHMYQNKAIITKDAFIACYKKWIEPEKEGEANGKNFHSK